jgi:formiminoglutamate deiminase
VRQAFHAELAVLEEGAAATDVLIELSGGVITRVTPGASRPIDAEPLPGLVLPGLVDVHGHAAHRLLRSRALRLGTSPDSWRRAMRGVVGRLDPESLLEVATAVYAELALAGITAVGEFHAVHHQASGERYDDPNALALSLVTAARDAGVRLTLFDACGAGLEAGAEEGAAAFADRDVAEWAARLDDLREALSGEVRVGAAIPDPARLGPDRLTEMAAVVRRAGLAVQAHVSETASGHDACLAATGRTPVGLLADAGLLSARTTAVHATWADADDLASLATAGAHVCICPTTERALGAGIAPARLIAASGSGLCLGSDSHTVIDLFEEARLAELDERLRPPGPAGAGGAAAPLGADQLLAAATVGGAAALGVGSGIVAGAPADLIALRLDTLRLATFDPADPVPHVVWSATAADVRHVVVGGVLVVEEGEHRFVDDVAGRLARAALLASSTR